MSAVREAYVAVCGPSMASHDVLRAAEEVGAGLAAAGAVVVTGGMGGVMEAASRGARSKRGLTVGLLPGEDRSEANGWVSVAIPTGLGELRNGLVVRAADVVVAIGGSPGTLAEVGLAAALERPVVGLGSYDLAWVEAASDPADAVLRALAHVRG